MKSGFSKPEILLQVLEQATHKAYMADYQYSLFF